MPGEDVHKALLDIALHRVPEVVGLGKEFLEGLYRGVVEPDKVLDTTFGGHPIKHHAENNALINYYYLLSLYHYRRGDPYVAGICLGRALHYVHDSAIMYREEAEHARIEHDMKKLVKNGVDVQRLCNTSSTAGQQTKAVEAFCTAYRRSVDMLKSFAEEISKPINIEEVRKRYRRARLLKALASLLLFTLSLLTMYIFFFTHIMESELVFSFLFLHMIVTLILLLPTFYMASRAGRFKLRYFIPLVIASLIPPHFIVLLLLALLIAFSYVPDAYIDAMKVGIAKTLYVTNVKTAY
jgi:hypothetical protein